VVREGVKGLGRVGSPPGDEGGLCLLAGAVVRDEVPWAISNLRFSKGRPSSAVPPLKNAKHPEDLLRMGRETSLPGRAATFSPPNALPVAPSTRSAGGARRVRVQPCGARGDASLPRSPRSPDGSARDERGVVRGQVGHLFGGA
jgi:hypothetical protein